MTGSDTGKLEVSSTVPGPGRDRDILVRVSTKHARAHSKPAHNKPRVHSFARPHTIAHTEAFSIAVRMSGRAREYSPMVVFGAG